MEDESECWNVAGPAGRVERWGGHQCGAWDAAHGEEAAWERVGRHGGGLDKACVRSFCVEDDSDGTPARWPLLALVQGPRPSLLREKGRGFLAREAEELDADGTRRG